MSFNPLKYRFEFTIPRNLELPIGYGINRTIFSKDKCPAFKICLEIIDRPLNVEGIDAESTTALFIADEDRWGERIKTKLEVEFELLTDIFQDGLENTSKDSKNLPKLTQDFLKGKRKEFFLEQICGMVNFLIEVHQYVNNKFHVFPIDKKSIGHLQIASQNGFSIHMGIFGGCFTNSVTNYEKPLFDNADRISSFIDGKEGFVEPFRVFKYSFEFYKMQLYRVAITEIQSAIETLLSDLIREKLGDKMEKKSKLIRKLETYSKIQNNFNFENFNGKERLIEAINIRNEIIHGDETPHLDKLKCLSYLQLYEKLFLELWNSRGDGK